MKKGMLLVAGAVITLLYLLLGSSLYEALYYEREFSNEMYNENLYFMVSVVTILVAWSFAAIYYSVSFSRWYHWFLVLVAACVAAPVINFAYPNSVFRALGYDFSAQLFGFCMVDLAIEAVLFVVVSFAIRWWSSNCRHTPIPE